MKIFSEPWDVGQSGDGHFAELVGLPSSTCEGLKDVIFSGEIVFQRKNRQNV